MLNYLRWCILIGALAANWANAAETQIMVTDDYMLAVIRTHEGYYLSQDFEVYRTSGEWYVPLAAFADELGLGIRVNVSDHTGSGFIFEESRSWSVDFRSGIAQYDGKSVRVSPDKIRYDSVEIYLPLSILNEVFPFETTVDPFKSMIVVKSTDTFPREAAERRGQRPNRQGRPDQINAQDLPNYVPKNHDMKGLGADQTFTVTSSRRGRPEYHGYTTFAGSFLGASVYGNASYDRHELIDDRITIEKRAPEGETLGPLGLTRIAMLDVPFPRLPLVGSKPEGRGFYLTNRDSQLPNSLTSQSFEGTIPKDWQAELFHNGNLVGRTTSSGGCYRFDDVALSPGLNTIKLIFYGPQGQVREEKHVYNISDELIAGLNNTYDFALVQQDGIHQTAIKASGTLADRASFTLGTDQLVSKSGSNSYGLIGLSTFIGASLLGIDYVTHDRDSHAWQSNLGVPIGMASLQIGSARFSNFRNRSGDIDESLLESSDAAIRFPLEVYLPLQLQTIFRQKRYVSMASQSFLEQVVSTVLGQYFLSNSWIQPIGTDQTGSGHLSLLTRGYQWYAKTGLYYRPAHLDRSELSLGYNPLGYEVLYALSHDTASRETRNRVSVGQSGDKFMWNIGVRMVHDELSSIDASVGWSLLGGSDRMMWTSPEVASGGNMLVCVFHDLNSNGMRDPEEPGLEEVTILISRTPYERPTNSEGCTLVKGVTAQSPQFVTLSIESLEDPAMLPSQEGFKVTLDRGEMAEVHFPIVTRGEADGIVYRQFSQSALPQRGIRIELLDANEKVVATKISASDGFYLFESLRPGTYILRVDPAQLRDIHAEVTPKVRKITISPKGSISSSQTFKLKFLE